MTLRVFIPLAAVLAASILRPGPSRAAEAEWRTVASPERRFSVCGDLPIEILLPIGRWADEVAMRLERTARVAAPERRAPCLLLVSTNPLPDPGRPAFRLGNPDSTDWQDAVARLCAFLVDVRVRAAARPESSRACRPPPPWLTEGLARWIDPALRASDRKTVLRLRRNGQAPGIAAVLAAVPDPSARAADPEVRGMVAGWLLALPDPDTRMNELWRRLAGGDDISPEWLSSSLPGCRDVADLERRWRSRLAEERYVIADPGLLTRDAVANLRDHVHAPPDDEILASGGPVPPNSPAKEMIRARAEPWAATAARAREARLQRLRAGAPPELSDAVAAWERFFGEFRSRSSESRLRSLLAEAEAALSRADALVTARERWLDEIERRTGATNESSGMLLEPGTP